MVDVDSNIINAFVVLFSEIVVVAEVEAVSE